MSSIASIGGTFALLAAALLTLLVTLSTSILTMRKPTGPDAMGLAGPLLAAILAWVFIAVGVLIAGFRGGLSWATPVPGAGALLGFAGIVGIGVVCVVGMGASLDLRSPWKTVVGMGTGFVLPMCVVAYVMSLLWVPAERLGAETWPRVFGYAMGGLAGLAWAAIGVAFLHIAGQKAKRLEEDQALRQREQEQNQRENERRDAEHARELAAMPDDAPITEFVTHLFIDKSEAHHARAFARIGSLPRLRERLVEALAHPVPLQREYVANYIRLSPSPDPAQAPAVARAIVLLAEDIERASESGELTHVKGMTKGMLMTAARFPHASFADVVLQLRQALERWPHEGTRAEALDVVDRYLTGEEITTGP